MKVGFILRKNKTRKETIVLYVYFILNKKQSVTLGVIYKLSHTLRGLWSAMCDIVWQKWGGDKNFVTSHFKV